MKRFKKIICFVLTSCLILSMQSLSSFALNTQSTLITKSYLKTCSLDELYSLSHKVERQRDVNMVFEEIVNRVSNSYSTQGTNGQTNVIDNYVSVKAASVSTSHVVTISFQVKANIPTSPYFDFSLGYEYPTECRTSGAKLNLSGTKKGYYTKTINTKGLVSGIYIVADVTARDYREHKLLKKAFDKPFVRKTAFQEITQTDVTLRKVSAAIPSIILFFSPLKGYGKMGQVVMKIAEALTIAVALDVETPDLAVGQYYKTIIDYSTDYECNVTLMVYSSKESYTAGKQPIYTSTSKIKLPQ